MTKIITAINDCLLNEELHKENNVEIICKDIQYKEGILEVLEKNMEVDYIIIDQDLPGEIILENLIEEILDKNEKIKIIITIKKEDKCNFNLNNENIIKIFYENKINLSKLKRYENNYENKNIKKENKIIKNKIININKFEKISKIEKNKILNCKILNFYGDTKVGKSVFIILLAYYLVSKNCKILLVELNEESPNLYTILGSKKFNNFKRLIYKKRKNKQKIKNKSKKIEIKYFKKDFEKSILEKLIIKINKNINLISYNKIINFNLLNKIKNKYDYLLIENYFNKNKNINYKLNKVADSNILLVNPDLLGIKNSIKIIKKNNIENSIKIIINKYNIYSIDEKIIINIFKKEKIIGKIKNNLEYLKLINSNFKYVNIKNKNFKKNILPIFKKII